MENVKEKILVIGSQNHKNADCVSWLQPLDNYYIGNYDIIIIFTPSLSKVILTRMELERNKNLEIIRDEILESLPNGEKLFICISSPNIITETTSICLGGEQTSTYSNYGWCPIEAVMKNKVVTSFDCKKWFIPKYMQNVERCNHYFDYNVNMVWLKNNKTKLEYKWDYDIDSLAYTGANKPLAFRFTLKQSINIKNIWEEVRKFSPITFIPPLTKLNASEGINILIKDMIGLREQIELPEWAKQIMLPGEEKLLKENEQDSKKIASAQTNIEKRDLELDKLDRFKGLLTTTDTLLEELVEEAFHFLDIDILKPVNQTIEDRYTEFGDYKCPIEIKGVTKSASQNHLKQIIFRSTDKGSEGYKTRGLLIVNHYLSQPIDKRNEPFPPNVKSEAERWGIALLTTHDVFNLVCKKLMGKKIINLREKIFNTIGVFRE